MLFRSLPVDVVARRLQQLDDAPFDAVWFATWPLVTAIRDRIDREAYPADCEGLPDWGLIFGATGAGQLTWADGTIVDWDNTIDLVSTLLGAYWFRQGQIRLWQDDETPEP